MPGAPPPPDPPMITSFISGALTHNFIMESLYYVQYKDSVQLSLLKISRILKTYLCVFSLSSVSPLNWRGATATASLFNRKYTRTISSIMEMLRHTLTLCTNAQSFLST